MKPQRGIFERSKGSGIWWVRYRDAAGKPHRERAGSKDLARDKLETRRREVSEGRYVAPRGGGRLTFAALATLAFDDKRLRLAPASYATDVIRLRRLNPIIGTVPAVLLAPARINQTLAGLKRSGLTNSTVNRFHALGSSIYTWGVANGKVPVNPFARVKRFRENESRIRWLRDWEEAAIRKEIPERSLELEFGLALMTGMRHGEQFSLEWSNVNLAGRRLIVHGKTGRRPVILNSAAVRILEELQGLTGKAKFVIAAAEDAKRDSRTWFKTAVKGAGVDNFRWHDTRHTFASRLVMAGVSIRAVQILLGHKSIEQTMKYAHLAAEHTDAAVEKLVLEPLTPAAEAELAEAAAEKLAEGRA